VLQGRPDRGEPLLRSAGAELGEPRNQNYVAGALVARHRRARRVVTVNDWRGALRPTNPSKRVNGNPPAIPFRGKIISTAIRRDECRTRRRHGRQRRRRPVKIGRQRRHLR